LGPKVAEDIGDGQAAYKELLKNMGYRLWVSGLAISKGESKVDITLNLENSGVAPLYGDWPVVLYLCNTNGKVLQAQQLDCRLSELLPVQTTDLKASFAYSKDQNYQVKLGILSPISPNKRPNTAKAENIIKKLGLKKLPGFPSLSNPKGTYTTIATTTNAAKNIGKLIPPHFDSFGSNNSLKFFLLLLPGLKITQLFYLHLGFYSFFH